MKSSQLVEIVFLKYMLPLKKFDVPSAVGVMRKRVKFMTELQKDNGKVNIKIKENSRLVVVR